MSERIMRSNMIIEWGKSHCKASNRWLFETMVVALGVLLIAVAAQITIPLQPVPVTLQDVTILFLAMSVGSKRGVAMVVSYLALGFAGAPVFAGLSAGPAFLLAPTAGYLLGFIPLAYLAGFLAERGWASNIFTCFAAGVLATLMLFIAGAGYLGLISSWHSALVYGVLPFVGASIIKLIAVSLVVPALWKK